MEESKKRVQPMSCLTNKEGENNQIFIFIIIFLNIKLQYCAFTVI